jgi:methyltransferase (TIGR00027 family)
MPRFFSIPFAAKLFIRLFAAKGAYEYVIARTKYIDAVVKQCLSAGFTQIVIFGAGFDTRALRFQAEARNARIYELDAAATQEAKTGQYKKRHLDIPSNVVFIPIDFDKESPVLKLEQSGFKRNERTLFLLEGVLMYLQPLSVDQTFEMLRELAGSGSEVVFDCIYASVLRHENIYYGEKGFADKVSSQGEQWNFGIEKGEPGQFVSTHGCKLVEHKDAGELEALYFKDSSGKTVGRINGTHFLTRALVIKD